MSGFCQNGLADPDPANCQTVDSFLPSVKLPLSGVTNTIRDIRCRYRNITQIELKTCNEDTRGQEAQESISCPRPSHELSQPICDDEDTTRDVPDFSMENCSPADCGGGPQNNPEVVHKIIRWDSAKICHENRCKGLSNDVSPVPAESGGACRFAPQPQPPSSSYRRSRLTQRGKLKRSSSPPYGRGADKSRKRRASAHFQDDVPREETRVLSLSRLGYGSGQSQATRCEPEPMPRYAASATQDGRGPSQRVAPSGECEPAVSSAYQPRQVIAPVSEYAQTSLASVQPRYSNAVSSQSRQGTIASSRQYCQSNINAPQYGQTSEATSPLRQSSAAASHHEQACDATLPVRYSNVATSYHGQISDATSPFRQSNTNFDHYGRKKEATSPYRMSLPHAPVSTSTSHLLASMASTNPRKSSFASSRYRPSSAPPSRYSGMVPTAYSQSIAVPSSFMQPSVAPSSFMQPSVAPFSFTQPSTAPSSFMQPSAAPSSFTQPSFVPPSFMQSSVAPSSFMQPSAVPSSYMQPSVAHSSFMQPSVAPSSFMQPSVAPSSFMQPSVAPSLMQPSVAPSSFMQPNVGPSSFMQPSVAPSSYMQPSVAPSSFMQPSAVPSSNRPSNIGPCRSDTFVGMQPSEHAVSQMYPGSLRHSKANTSFWESSQPGTPGLGQSRATLQAPEQYSGYNTPRTYGEFPTSRPSSAYATPQSASATVLSHPASTIPPSRPTNAISASQPYSVAGTSRHPRTHGTSQYPIAIGSSRPASAIGTSQYHSEFETSQFPSGTKTAQYQRFTGTSQHQSVVGPSQLQSVVGPSQHQSVVGPSQHQRFVGPSQHQSVVGPSQHPSVVGPSQHPRFVGPSQHPNVVGTSQQPSVMGTSRYPNASVMGTSRQPSAVGASRYAGAVGASRPQNALGTSRPPSAQNVSQYPLARSSLRYFPQSRQSSRNPADVIRVSQPSQPGSPPDITRLTFSEVPSTGLVAESVPQVYPRGTFMNPRIETLDDGEPGVTVLYSSSYTIIPPDASTRGQSVRASAPSTVMRAPSAGLSRKSVRYPDLAYDNGRLEQYEPTGSQWSVPATGQPSAVYTGAEIAPGNARYLGAVGSNLQPGQSFMQADPRVSGYNPSAVGNKVPSRQPSAPISTRASGNAGYLSAVGSNLQPGQSFVQADPRVSGYNPSAVGSYAQSGQPSAPMSTRASGNASYVSAVGSNLQPERSFSQAEPRVSGNYLGSQTQMVQGSNVQSRQPSPQGVSRSSRQGTAPATPVEYANDQGFNSNAAPGCGQYSHRGEQPRSPGPSVERNIGRSSTLVKKSKNLREEFKSRRSHSVGVVEEARISKGSNTNAITRERRESGEEGRVLVTELPVSRVDAKKSTAGTKQPKFLRGDLRSEHVDLLRPQEEVLALQALAAARSKSSKRSWSLQYLSRSKTVTDTANGPRGLRDNATPGLVATEVQASPGRSKNQNHNSVGMRRSAESAHRSLMSAQGISDAANFSGLIRAQHKDIQGATPPLPRDLVKVAQSSLDPDHQHSTGHPQPNHGDSTGYRQLSHPDHTGHLQSSNADFTRQPQPNNADSTGHLQSSNVDSSRHPMQNHSDSTRHPQVDQPDSARHPLPDSIDSAPRPEQPGRKSSSFSISRIKRK